MTEQTIRINIDRKVERMLTEGKSVDNVISQIKSTKDNFTKLLIMDTNSAQRTNLMKMYLDYSEVKLKDMITLKEYIQSEQ